jgi:hypothetical protein
MDAKLKAGQEIRVQEILIKLTDITLKRLPLDPRTGLGDDELRITLLVKSGNKEEEIVLFKQYVNEQPAATFEGYEIILRKADMESVELAVSKSATVESRE